MKPRMMRHEWRLLVADRTPWIILAVFGLALAYGLTNGVRWTTFQEQAITGALQEEALRYAQARGIITRNEREGRPVAAFGDPRNPDFAGRNSAARYAVLPPLPLAPTAIGQSDLLPQYARVTIEPRQTLLALGEIENPHRLLAGRFDLAFVLIYLLPLLIIALGYNLMSGEKERGTLALMLSQPVTLGTILKSKIAFRAALLAAILLACAVVALALGAIRLPDVSAFARLLLWLAVVAAYGAFWFALVIAVTALGKGSSTNALALTGIWLALVLVVPSTLNLLATTVYPVPSRVEMIQAMRTAAEEAQAEGSGLLAGYFEDHPELGGVAPDEMAEFALTRLLVAEEVNLRVQPVIERHEAQLAAQQALVDRLRFLSPAVVTLEALTDVAGTGMARHRHFSAVVTEFHEQWQAFFAARIRDGETILRYQDLPEFRYSEESLGAVMRRVGTAGAALLIPAFVIGAAGLRRLRRYPVAG